MRITDFVAEVILQHRFENTVSSPLEAIFEMLVAPNALFRVEIDGKTFEGKMVERDKAMNQYDDALAQGHETGDGYGSLFTASIGSLPPGKAVLVTVAYVTELDFEDDKLRFVLPVQPFAPRSTESVHTKFMLPVSADCTQAVPYGLKVQCLYAMSHQMSAIASPSHQVLAELSEFGRKASVQLVHTEVGSPLQKDFVLSAMLANPHQACLRLERFLGGRFAALLSVYPKLESDVLTEMVFVVDRSGSMKGSRIASVRETLQIFLRSLPESTSFNIIGFGTNTQSLFPQSRAYNAKAVEHVARMDADLGGTDIIKPLMEVFSTDPKRGVARQVFLLTDGEVKNTHECIDTVRMNATSTRLFTFGIGNDASRPLVLGMAEAGEGNAEFVHPGEHMEEQVLRQLRRALMPALTDVSISWGEHPCVVQPAPFRTPPLFGGKCLHTYALFSDAPSAVTVTVKAVGPSGAWSASVSLSAADAVDGRTVSRLAARRLIRDLQDKRSYMHDDMLDVASGKFTAEDVTKEIISLSVASGVTSALTAFVITEERGYVILGSAQLVALAPRRLPAAAEGGYVSRAMFTAPDGTLCRVAEMSRSKTGKHGSAKVHLVVIDPVTGKKTEHILSSSAVDSNVKADPAAIAEAQRNSVLSILIKHANASGAFPFQALKPFFSDLTKESITDTLPGNLTGPVAEQILITAIVCVIFSTVFPDRKVHWDLVAQKAQRWIAKETATLSTTEQISWAKLATEFIEVFGLVKP